MKDDTSSLLLIRDSWSCYTRESDVSKISMQLDPIFDFDREIISSRAYQTAMQSHIRRLITSSKRLETQSAQLRTPNSASVLSYESDIIEGNGQTEKEGHPTISGPKVNSISSRPVIHAHNFTHLGQIHQISCRQLFDFFQHQTIPMMLCPPRIFKQKKHVYAPPRSSYTPKNSWLQSYKKPSFTRKAWQQGPV